MAENAGKKTNQERTLYVCTQVVVVVVVIIIPFVC